MKIIRLVFFLVLVVSGCLFSFGVGAEPIAAVTGLPLVSEENVIPQSVFYYQNTTQYEAKNLRPNQTVFLWTEGRNGGTALHLNGNKQYIRLRTSVFNTLESFTLSSWVKLDSAETPQSNRPQKLLTIFVNQHAYLSVSLHENDAQTGPNAPCLQWASPETEPQTICHKAVDGTSFALPAEEWHHIAVAVSSTAMDLYIDGAPYLHADVTLDFTQLNPVKFYIGAGYGAEPTLTALLQDAVLYPTILDNAQIAALANDADPFAETPSTTVVESLATCPPTTTAAAVHMELPSGRVLGLPISLIVVLGALVVLFAILSVTFSIRIGRANKPTNDIVFEDKEELP